MYVSWRTLYGTVLSTYVHVFNNIVLYRTDVRTVYRITCGKDKTEKNTSDWDAQYVTARTRSPKKPLVVKLARNKQQNGATSKNHCCGSEPPKQRWVKNSRSTGNEIQTLSTCSRNFFSDNLPLFYFIHFVAYYFIIRPKKPASCKREGGATSKNERRCWSKRCRTEHCESEHGKRVLRPHAPPWGIIRLK